MLRKCISSHLTINSTIFSASAAHPLYYSTGCMDWLTVQHTWHSKPHKNLNISFTYKPIQWNISALYTPNFKASHIISHTSITSTQPIFFCTLPGLCVTHFDIQYVHKEINIPAHTSISHVASSDSLTFTNTSQLKKKDNSTVQNYNLTLAFWTRQWDPQKCFTSEFKVWWNRSKYIKPVENI